MKSGDRLKAILLNSYFNRTLGKFPKSANLRSCFVLNQKVELKVVGSIPTDDKVFRPFLTLKSHDNDEFHVPTQSWFAPIIENCGRISLIAIICNVADYI